MAFLMEQAGGARIDGRRRILDLGANTLHQRVPLIIGSAARCERVEAAARAHPSCWSTAAPRRCSRGAACFGLMGDPCMSTQPSHHLDHRLVRRRHDVGEEARSSRSSAARTSTPSTSRATPSIATTAPRCATQMAEEAERGNKHFSHFSPETNLLEELEKAFRDYGETGTGTTRHYVHDERGGRALRRPARHLHRLGAAAGELRPAVLRRPARRRRHRQGQRRALCRPQDRRRARHQSRMDPEAAPRPQRRAATRPRRSPTPSCGACRTTCTTSARNSPRPTSTSSACRRSTPRTRSSRAGSRRRTNRWW